MKKLKIGLVLGGGGARGLAHIGVLQTLQAYDIPIDVVTGTSMGAMVGAVFAQKPDADFVERKFRSYIKSDGFASLGGSQVRQNHAYEPEDLLHQLSREIKRRVVINMAAHRKSLLKTERLQKAIESVMEDSTIENTVLPYACAAVDLTVGNEVIFTEGPIRKAVLASAAIPGFIPPVENSGHQLVDGSVCMNFPIEAARKLGADIIIAVNVSADIDPGVEADNVVDIIIRSNLAATAKINQLLLQSADFVINPPIGNIAWTAFEELDLLIEKGQAETQRSIPELKRLIKSHSGLTGRIRKYIQHYLQSYLGCRS
jgi:NTE family protein